jgi:hypothetical protein
LLIDLGLNKSLSEFFSFRASDDKFMAIDGWGWTWRHGVADGFVILLFAIGDYEETTSVTIVVTLSLGKKKKI